MPRHERVRDVSPELAQAARSLRSEPTRAERVVWEALRGRRLAGLKFRRQHAVGPFVLDFFCAERKLVIEIDGGVHDLPGQRERDAERTAMLNAVGYRVVRARNEEVFDQLDAVVARILAAAGESALIP